MWHQQRENTKRDGTRRWKVLSNSFSSLPPKKTLSYDEGEIARDNHININTILSLAQNVINSHLFESKAIFFPLTTHFSSSLLRKTSFQETKKTLARNVMCVLTTNVVWPKMLEDCHSLKFFFLHSIGPEGKSTDDNRLWVFAKCCWEKKIE